MAAPVYVLWDSDALFQLFISRQYGLLGRLERDAGIASFVVPEVDAELRSNRKFGQRFAASVKKARTSGRLKLLDYTNLQLFDPARYGAPAVAQAVAQSIRLRGQANDLRVDVGEAYAHAAASVLGIPLVSNDFNAVQTLVQQKKATASPTLRFFDVVVFAHQKGWLTETECNRIRKDLAAEGEHVPKAFKRASFAKGLGSFRPRLIAGESGLTPGNWTYDFQKPLVI